eukprot:snap_masked-scaffold_9-processed-gene-3.13-mRNA-1 protein AED:1.00 eAED:1.00 QI:0/-1/0/0/-1/1/1/0/68
MLQLYPKTFPCAEIVIVFRSNNNTYYSLRVEFYHIAAEYELLTLSFTPGGNYFVVNLKEPSSSLTNIK